MCLMCQNSRTGPPWAHNFYTDLTIAFSPPSLASDFSLWASCLLDWQLCGRSGTAPLILNLRSGRLYPRPFNPAVKNPWYPLRRRLGGPQGLSGRCGMQKHLFPLQRIEARFLGSPAHNVVVVPTEVLLGVRWSVIIRGPHGTDVIVNCVRAIVPVRSCPVDLTGGNAAVLGFAAGVSMAWHRLIW